jgi:membrane protein required for colicin V production
MIKSMIWIDFILIGLVSVFLVTGLIRGLGKEVFSLCFWMLASWVSLTFSQEFSVLLASTISNLTARMVVSFSALFLMTLSLGGVIDLLLKALAKDTRISFMDRLGGMILGAVHGLVVVAVVVILVGLTPMPKDSWWAASTVIPPFQILALWLRDHFQLGIAEAISYR